MLNKNVSTLLCLFVLYFIQALPYGFQSRYLPLIMRQLHNKSLTSLGLYKLLLLPWVCKFFISDIINLFKVVFGVVAGVTTLVWSVETIAPSSVQGYTSIIYIYIRDIQNIY